MKFTIKIPFKNGLHARPASELVKLCNTFISTILMTYKGKSKSMKSIVSILSLGIVEASILEIEVSGDDEVEASKSIKMFFKRNVNE